MQAWELRADGTWEQRAPRGDEPRLASQRWLMERALKRMAGAMTPDVPPGV